MVGNLTVNIGTWESHAAPNRSFQQAEEARRKYGSMAVGPAHSRGVAGVMSGGVFPLWQIKMPILEIVFFCQSPYGVLNCEGTGSLEGAGSKMQRDEEVLAVH